MEFEENTPKEFDTLANALKCDTNIEINNNTFGTILYKVGTFGDLSLEHPDGFGMKHIIQGRYEKDKYTSTEICALLYLIWRVASEATGESVIFSNSKRFGIEIDGIKVILAKDYFGDNEKWIITGYQDDREKRKPDVIEAVVATYNYALENSDYHRQVGAVISDINRIRANLKRVKSRA